MSRFQTSANIPRSALIRVRGGVLTNKNETIQQQILKRQLFFRQYYPEGEWGYIILLCAFISAIICQGIQLSVGVISLSAERRFFRRFLPDLHQNYAGKFYHLKYVLILSWFLLQFCS